MINYLPSISNIDINSYDTIVHVCRSCRTLQYAALMGDNQCQACGSDDVHDVAGALSYVGVKWNDKGVERCGQVLVHNEARRSVMVEVADGPCSYVELDVSAITDTWTEVSTLTVTQLAALNHLSVVRTEAAKRLQPETELANELSSVIEQLQAMFSRGMLTGSTYIMNVHDAVTDVLDRM